MSQDDLATTLVKKTAKGVFEVYKLALQPVYLAARKVLKKKAEKTAASPHAYVEAEAITGALAGAVFTGLGVLVATAVLATGSTGLAGALGLAGFGMLVTGVCSGFVDAAFKARGGEPLCFKDEDIGLRAFYKKNLAPCFSKAAKPFVDAKKKFPHDLPGPGSSRPWM